MSGVTMEVALSSAVNVLRNTCSVRKMPSGEPLDDAVVEVLLDAADLLERTLNQLDDRDSGP